MPEVKAADNELETYQKQLVTIGQGKVAEFETEYKKYAEDAQKVSFQKCKFKPKKQNWRKSRMKFRNTKLKYKAN